MINNWIKIAQADDFATNVGGCVKLQDKHIAVFNFEDRTQWYAIDNLCPHRQQDVLSRGIIGETSGEPKVACPLHKNSFSLKTGKCLTDDNLSAVRTYDIKCEEGTLYLNLDTPEK